MGRQKPQLLNPSSLTPWTKGHPLDYSLSHPPVYFLQSMQVSRSEMVFALIPLWPSSFPLHQECSEHRHHGPLDHCYILALRAQSKHLIKALGKNELARKPSSLAFLSIFQGGVHARQPDALRHWINPISVSRCSFHLTEFLFNPSFLPATSPLLCFFPKQNFTEE